MAKFGDADSVTIADSDLGAAEASAKRVNSLLETPLVHPARIDVTDAEALVSLLASIDSFLSAVPYWLNPAITQAAIRAKANMCDLGGKTDLVLEQMKSTEAAKAAGISVVPDCGQVPGLGTSLAMYAMALLDRTDEIYMWDGGNDQHPRPPFNYVLTFNIAGLTNEYYEDAVFLRDHKITKVKTFQEEDYEEVSFAEPIGTMEAFVAGGGTSTVPWSFEGKLKTFQNKTLRWKGHFAQWKAVMDMGLMDLDPVRVNGMDVVPRDVLHACVDPKIRATDSDRDFVIVRIRAVGMKHGADAELQIDLIDYYDEETGFTAMERTTGWHGAIVAIMSARGQTPRGVNPVEAAVPALPFIEELNRRGIRHEVSWHSQ
jgi:lysine 6-dehydrogenase